MAHLMSDVTDLLGKMDPNSRYTTVRYEFPGYLVLESKTGTVYHIGDLEEGKISIERYKNKDQVYGGYQPDSVDEIDLAQLVAKEIYGKCQ